VFGKRDGCESGEHVKIKISVYNKDVLRDRNKHGRGKEENIKSCKNGNPLIK
jgi:hypothetical protein